MIKDWFVEDDGRLRPHVAWGAIALAVGASLYFGYRAWSRDSRSHRVALMCMTEGCDYQREESLQVGETLPLKCPKCGKMSVVPSFTCPNCGTPNVWNEDRGLKPPTKCTKCGKENYHG